VSEARQYDVLGGIRVVELSSYAFAPAAGAILAEWGADVIRVGRPDVADPLMSNPVKGMAEDSVDVAYMWEILNRAKRSIGLDLTTLDGRAVFDALIDRADVFLTSALPAARRKLAITADDLRASNPRLVYACASGNGPTGPESERGGFDASSFWARSGLADASFAMSGEHSQPAMAIGDLASGTALAAGIVGALLRRERTGEGGLVDVSLFGSAVWLQSPSIVAAGVYGVPRLPLAASERPKQNPLVATYRTADDRYVTVASLAGDRGWDDLCRVAGRADLAADPRFRTLADRLAHDQACRAELTALFAAHPLPRWLELLDGTALQACPVQTAAEVLADPMATANGYVRAVTAASGTTFATTATPVQFDGAAGATERAPMHGEQTETVLLELGYQWDEIAELKATGAIL
jgi:crotonobetainyl-CoA:carnitine CoA-transferase CaiB-like acyl-CoA transferase